MNNATHCDIHILRATISCRKKNLRHCLLFWLDWPVYDLVLVIPPPPLIKVASNTRPCSKLEGTTLNGGKEEVSIISHRPVTNSGWKVERPVLRRSVSTCLQLVVALHLGDLFRSYAQAVRETRRLRLTSLESLFTGHRIY